jgi:hypothetical protein
MLQARVLSPLIAMSDALTLKDVRGELRGMRLLHKGLAERLIPVDEPLEDGREGIKAGQGKRLRDLKGLIVKE